MLMIVIIRCEECALCRADYRSTSLKPSNYPDSRQARPALDVWEKTEIFVYQTEDWGGLGRILIGDTEILTQIVSNDFSLSPLELQPPLQQFFLHHTGIFKGPSVH